MGEQIIPWDLLEAQGKLAAVGAGSVSRNHCYSCAEELGCWEAKESEFRFNLGVSDDCEEHFAQGEERDLGPFGKI